MARLIMSLELIWYIYKSGHGIFLEFIYLLFLQIRIKSPEKETLHHTKLPDLEMGVEDRVQLFEKNAQAMIRMLLQAYSNLLHCHDDQQIEDFKMEVAPDAATLISQGDTMVFETNGMPEDLFQRMLNIQQELRNKFKLVQSYR